MNKLYPQLKKDKRYEIRLRGFSPDFNIQLRLHKEMEKLLERLPKDSKIEMRITKGHSFESQLTIKGSIFGCNLKAVSNNFGKLIEKAFSSIEKEIDDWKKSPMEHNEFVPYFGGYPAYYKELRV